MLFPSSGGTGKCQILSSAGNDLGNKIIGKNNFHGYENAIGRDAVRRNAFVNLRDLTSSKMPSRPSKVILAKQDTIVLLI